MTKIEYTRDLCDFCGTCVAVCPHDSIDLSESNLIIDIKTCTLCLNCVHICPVRALKGDDEKQI